MDGKTENAASFSGVELGEVPLGLVGEKDGVGQLDGAGLDGYAGNGADKGGLDPEEKPEDDPMFYNTWRKVLSTPFTKAKSKALLRELLSGLTVSLAQVPEAVAFAFTAGVDPIVGLQAAWIVGLVTALFGGAPGMVSGATGALAVVMPAFVEEFGVEYLFIAVLLMGVLQLLFALLGGAKLIKLVGHPIMLGFCNGLAIVILMAQFHSFKWSRFCPVPCDAPDYDWDQCVEMPAANATLLYKCEKFVTGATAAWQALEVVSTMAVIWGLPKLTKLIPGSLAGILTGMFIEFAIVRPAGFSTYTVEDLASVEGSFPIPVWLDDRYSANLPSLGDWETYRVCLPISATLAVIGLVESLMTLQLVGQITNKKPSPPAEAFAQGAANVVCGIFGGMGGCAMIGQSMINVKSGGVTRISTSFAAAFLLVIILAAYPAINLVPVASLAGVMFMVVIGTFEWHSIPIVIASFLPERVRAHKRLKWVRKVKRSDAFIIVLVTVVAVLTDLAIAVGSGVVFSCLVFAWDQESHLMATQVNPTDSRAPTSADFANANVGGDEERGGDSPGASQLNRVDSGLPEGVDPSQVKIYQVTGPLFFASAQKFITLFDPIADPTHVVLYLDQMVLSDYSAMVAINAVARKYQALDKQLHLRKVSPTSMKVIRKAHHLIYTYDKNRTADVNESELISMELTPSWQAADVPVFVNPYPVGYGGAAGGLQVAEDSAGRSDNGAGSGSDNAGAASAPTRPTSPAKPSFATTAMTNV